LVFLRLDFSPTTIQVIHGVSLLLRRVINPIVFRDFLKKLFVFALLCTDGIVQTTKFSRSLTVNLPVPPKVALGFLRVDIIRFGTNNTNARQASLSGKFDDMLDSLVGRSASNVADNKYLMAIDDIALGDVSPG